MLVLALALSLLLIGLTFVPPCRLVVYDDNFEKYRIKANMHVQNNHNNQILKKLEDTIAAASGHEDPAVGNGESDAK